MQQEASSVISVRTSAAICVLLISHTAGQTCQSPFSSWRLTVTSLRTQETAKGWKCYGLIPADRGKGNID